MSPAIVVRKAVSVASRPVAIRTRLCRGARYVASTTCHRPSTWTSATAWKSIGHSPGAYTDTQRAGMSRAGLAWFALVICIALVEPFGFLIAGEVLVLLVIVVIERIRSIPSIVALILVPPAMYVLFEILLEVQLPEGTLWR